ncbi:prolyl oligopeptidase family serine peptidase [bacterium]|nr:prolyl oligopeptidase family serine peptidase [bacterium]
MTRRDLRIRDSDKQRRVAGAGPKGSPGTVAILLIASVVLNGSNAFAQTEAAQGASPLREVAIISSVDSNPQPAMIFVPPNASNEAVPLLVILHSWSADYTQKNFIEPCLVECQQRKWALIHPNFRGPNLRPEACGSDLAVQDVLDAVEFMRDRTRVDPARIYLVGTSGGGHMSLLMAGRAPQVWAAVSSWVPISDVAAWHSERTVRGGYNDKYRNHMQKVCGGPPGASAEVDKQYTHRSPLTHLAKGVNIPIDINTGIHDGHTGSVPVNQSLQAFNLLVKTAGKPNSLLKHSEIRFMTANRRISPQLVDEGVNDTVKQDTRKKPVLFRRQAAHTRITIFDGGHESDMPTAVRWLAKQRKTN